MPDFIVKKLIWEYGENYGHIYCPKNISDLKEKINELNSWGKNRDYPFFVALYFNDFCYVGFTVAHEYSLLELSYEENGVKKGPFYLNNPDGNKNEIIPIYYFASYTEPDTTKMIPFDKVLEAVYFFVEHRKFPPHINFEEEEVNKKFVTPSLGN